MTNPAAGACDIKAALKAQGQLLLAIICTLAMALTPIAVMLGLFWFATTGATAELVVAVFFYTLVFGFLAGTILFDAGWLVYKTFQPLIDVVVCIGKEKWQARRAAAN